MNRLDWIKTFIKTFPYSLFAIIFMLKLRKLMATDPQKAQKFAQKIISRWTDK